MNFVKTFFFLDENLSENFKKKRKNSINKAIINPIIIPKLPLNCVDDNETANALKTLSENGLHGKLATAQLHAKTLKMEQEMSEIERQKVLNFFFFIYHLWFKR